MNDSEIRKLIRQEIQEALAPIMMAVLNSNDSSQRISARRFPSEGPIANIRNLAPYGLSSRANPGTECMLIPVMHDPSHINCAAFFDKTRPDCQDGETILYDANSHIIYLSKTKMQFGSKSSANPMMLGDVVQKLFQDLLTAISTHTHIGNIGYQTSAPNEAQSFIDLKTSPVDDSKINSDKCFCEK